MTREERAWEAYAQIVREQAPAGKYAARSILDSPSEQDKRAVAAMLAFADAEAAAMRERAAGVVESTWTANHTPDQWKNPNALCDFIAANVRALPATGEVGRG